MPAQHIATLLAASGEFQRIAREARRLAELQQVFLDAAPPEFARVCRVKSCRAGTLVLWADNAAIATKLRQIAPRLLTAFKKQVAEINGVRVEVQVKIGPGGARNRASRRTLPVEIIEQFSELAERTADPGLRSALTHFGHKKRRQP